MPTSSVEKIRESIQSLQDYLESSDCTDEVYPRKQRERQDCKALRWAAKNRLLIIEEAEFLVKWEEFKRIRGGENLIYYEVDTEGLVWAIKMNTLLYHGNNMAGLADRLIISSEYFPDTTIEIIGMVKTNSGVKPLLRQQFVVTKPKVLARRVDIWNALKEMGFRLLDPDNEKWLSPDHAYYMRDPGPNNVLVDENGDFAFIDVIFEKVSPEKLKNDFQKLDLSSPIP
jgi:hypothetical protein